MRKTRCKGRTASGRIMKGYRLTRGGLVKVTAKSRKRTTTRRTTARRRRRGNGRGINMVGLFPDRRQLSLFA